LKNTYDGVHFKHELLKMNSIMRVFLTRTTTLSIQPRC